MAVNLNSIVTSLHTRLHAALPITVSLYQWSPGTDHLHEVLLTLSQRPQQRLPPLLPHAVEVELQRAGRETLPPHGESFVEAVQSVQGAVNITSILVVSISIQLCGAKCKVRLKSWIFH